ncbi:MAG: hypothetical protein IT244_06470, partial [Bacteroidia bacterium]|nr:hypothetical protein [Bacteroidia bacterium]
MKYFVFILAFFFGTTAWSQSALNKKISVSFTQLKTEAALHIIERAASIKFGYNAEIFPADSLITGVFDNVELQIVLDKLLGKNYAYREKGNYIIIKSTKEIQAKNEKYIYTISGYIRDSETGETIAFASIYDSATLNATLSNEAGFYTLNVEQKPGEISQIGISKSAYKDTFILVKPADTKVLTVELDKIKDSMPVAALDSGKRNLDKNIFVNSLTNAKQRLQSLNLSKKFTKGWQVSFVPYLGTNGVLSGKVTNSASFNIIGGYAGGLNGVE